MKRLLLPFLISVCWGTAATAQCTTANVNWDNLDYLISTGNYSGFVSAAQTRDQRFAFGPGVLRVQTSGNLTVGGENTTHTGETGAYGTGADAFFATTATSGATLTLSFDGTAVSAIRFSIFDVDNNQKITVAATNGAVPVSTTVSKANGSSGISFASNPGNTPLINGIGGDYTVSDNNGAVNVDIAGPATSVVLTFSNATGDFWLSDIQGCMPGSFATDYYAVSKPWPGQPSYILSTPDNNWAYAVNPANGAAKQLFPETGAMYINGMGYDPYNRKLFYTLDDTVSGVTQKTIKYHDFDMETSTTLVADASTWGLPLFNLGVESASAAFYDGCLYLGIEGGNTANNSGRESIVWRITFDASYNPVTICQVFAVPSDNGSGTKTHDWGDIAVKDGVLYDWDSGNSGGSQQNIYHYNLQTQTIANTYSGSGIPFSVSQVASTWNGTLYQVRNYITQYNNAGSYTGGYPTIAGPSWSGSAGDAAEAFKPKADFGDAPAVYENVDTPAVHEMDTTLRLGATIDREWVKEGSTAMANADGGDEDGVGFVPLLCPCSGNFNLSVKVYNHTGANATLTGWLDYDGDGKFEASEAMTATVPSGTALQTVNLFWTNANTTMSNLSYTYLRVRLTSVSNGMTTANATGYFANGEVEDYRVFVNGYFLANNLLSFTASRTASDNVKLSWRASEDASLGQYAVQKSTDGKVWNNIALQPASGQSKTVAYSFEDASLRNGITYYRLELMQRDGAAKLSDVRTVGEGSAAGVVLRPNPVQNRCSLELAASAAETTELRVLNAAGVCVHTQKVQLVKGANAIDLNLSSLPGGAYHIQLNTVRGLIDKSLIKR